MPVSFALLLNLVSASNASDKDLLWGFIRSYAPEADPESHPILDNLVDFAIRYYEDFVKPAKNYRPPTAHEREALNRLKSTLIGLPPESEAGDIQSAVFTVGKEFDYEPLRDWFKALYETLLGQQQGPRMGSFIALYGIDRTIALIDTALERS